MLPALPHRGGAGLEDVPHRPARDDDHRRTDRDVQVDEKSSLWAGSSTGIIVVRDDVLIAPWVFTTARDDGVVAGTPVVHQERNERGVVLEDGVWRRTVAARMTTGEGAEVPAVVRAPIGATALLETAALPTTTALPHGS